MRLLYSNMFLSIIVQSEIRTSLNKFISQTGFCSRREADKLLEQGRVTVNGDIAKPGNRVIDNDAILIDGLPLYTLFHDYFRLLKFYSQYHHRW